MMRAGIPGGEGDSIERRVGFVGCILLTWSSQDNIYLFWLGG